MPELDLTGLNQEWELMGRTLVVDDDEDMRVLARETINVADRGLRVVGEATSGEEALTLRRVLDLDIVVLDYLMPGLSGIETAKALLAEDPDLPIVLYTAYLDADLAKEAERVGIRRCVAKGHAKALIDALRDLVSRSAA